jgi:hypothetical protein
MKDKTIKIINRTPEGGISISKRDRKGPIGISTRLYEMLEEFTQGNVKPKKAGKQFHDFLDQFKKKDAAEGFRQLQKMLEDKPFMAVYLETITMQLPENTSWLSVLAPEAEVKAEDKETIGNEPPKVTLGKEHQLAKPLDERTFSEVMHDEVNHRPGIIAAQLRTQWMMGSWRLKHLLGL